MLTAGPRQERRGDRRLYGALPPPVAHHAPGDAQGARLPARHRAREVSQSLPLSAAAGA